ncbi:MAG: hypothetical protein JHC86_00960, partial [Ilumatobacteraceae bacterium]|nr:hypothetical protein [Ilumatobacteraceae bacterium]
MQRKLFHAFGMVGFAALLALNLASCAGSKAAALPIASDLVPTENGWSFANYPSSAFPDVQFDTVDMLAMFGNDTNVCIDGIADPCILTAEAATWAQMVNQSRASGSCMGLAVLAAQRFNDNVSPVTATLGSDESTLRAVARAFATQFLSEAQAESEKWLQSSLSDIVKTVKASLAENKVDYTLGLFGPNGGHAVTPFAVEYPSDGVARLMVYDSNWPGRNRYVDVNSEADTWTFSYSSDTPETDPEPWVGGRGDMDLTPIRFEKLTCPFCATDVEVKNTSFLIRTDDPEFSLETEAGVITQDGTALPEGASVLKVKGAVGTRTYDYIVKLPQRELSAANTRNELRVKGNASVFAMIPSGIAQFQTSAKMVSPVVFTDNSVSTTDPTISLKVASKNLVASVSGSSTSLTLEGNALSVAVTLPGGEIVQQRVDESQPALLSEVNPSTGEVVVLQASESGQVTRTEIATDGTRTENISAEKLDLVSVVPVLPPTLESVANPALPAPADRDLNNPSYKADAAYVAPVATSQAPQSDPTPTTEALRSTATADTAPTSTIPLAATADTTPNTIREVTTTVSPATTATTTTTLPRTTITTTTTTTLPRTTITTTTTLPRTTTTLPRTTITTTTTLPRTTTTL